MADSDSRFRAPDVVGGRSGSLDEFMPEPTRAQFEPGPANSGPPGCAAETSAELRELLARLTRQLSVSDVAAYVAHEISQPLGVMLMHASACVRWLNQNPPAVDEARKAAEAIVRDGNRARKVLEAVREVVPELRPRLAPVDLNREIVDAVELASAELEAQGIELRWSLGSLPRIPCDRVQLTQVVLNLATNAMEAMAGAAEERTLSISTSYDPDEGAVVTVRDSGTGLDPGVANRIFAPMFTTKTGAFGLGLSIARRIVEAHGGRLWATSNEGRGATFCFTIPVTRQE